MKSYFIDTNVILRFILKDNIDQYNKTKDLFKKAEEEKVKILLLGEVIAEISYVLIKVYEIEKTQCVDILLALIENKHVHFMNTQKEIMIYAINIYSENNIDIVDSILYANAKISESEIFSFDNDFLKKIKE